MIKVVIADDEEKVCQLIKGLIAWEDLGMEVVGVAYNGVEALELVREKLPDLIITDIRMPGYDGLELIKYSKEIKDNIYFIIISGFQHFQYAQSAMKYGVSDYLLKPIKEEDLLFSLNKMKQKHSEKIAQKNNLKLLESRLKHKGIILRDNLFSEVIFKQADFDINTTIDQINKDYNYSFRPGFFQVAIVKIDSANEEPNTRALPIVKDNVTKTINRLLLNHCFDFSVCDDKSWLYIVLNANFDLQTTVRKQLKNIVEELNARDSVFSHFKFTLGAGSIVEEIKLLHGSYRAARFSIMERLLDDTMHFIEKTPIDDDLNEYNALLLALNRRLETAIEVLDIENVLGCINNLKQETISLNQLNGESVYWLLEEVWEMYVQHLRINQFISVSEDRPLESFANQANNCGSLDELFDHLLALIDQSMTSIKENQKQRETKPIRIAKQYIQQHYMNSITLEEISNLVGFNPTYFSTLFKKNSGSNFVDYLSEVRINKAKELLKETDLSVAVICEEVGYLDMKHFKKMFKKKTGLNPNEFRKLYA